MLNQHEETLQMCTMSVIGLVYENAQTTLHIHTLEDACRQDLCVLKPTCMYI